MAVHVELQEAQIAEIARAFGLPAPERHRPEPKGGVNTNYHLWAGGERYFLRLAEGKSDADVRFEVEVHRYLQEAHFPVPRLIELEGGGPFLPVLGRQAMVFAWVPGEEAARDQREAARCRRIGEQLARLHDLSSGFLHERPNPHGPGAVRRWLEPLEAGAADPELRAALPLFREELEEAGGLPGVARGLIHGDLFADNVLWIGDRVSAVLDWEMGCSDAFALDLAIALHAWCYGDGYVPARARALLEGYRSKRKVERETLDALYPYARFAALRFAVSRVHGYHLAALGPDRLARKDWRRYRDRLLALRAMEARGFSELTGI
jgi:homoserine kinase type II